MTSNILFHAAHARIVRPGADSVLTAFSDLSWKILEGQTWAIVGPVGSGKTTLADTLRGRLRVTEGDIAWPFLEDLRASGRTINWPADAIHVVSFKEESRAFSHSNHYYQQRFNFIEAEDDLTLRDFLRSGLVVEESELLAVATRFRLADKLDLSVIKLSNGQTRRARLARAMLRKPDWLILDEPFIGLDTASRADLSDLLANLVTTGHRLMLITRPDAIPEWVTDVVELEAGAIRWQGPRGDYQPPVSESVPVEASAPESVGEPVIELREVTVTYGGQTILDRVNWTVRAGERWALLGPNGSGKTTLLSLIAGDHPQAYGNDVRLFGKRRGTGESIWDIKKNLGLVSPEIHLYFSAPLTASETIATGFYDVMAYRPTTPEQQVIIRQFTDYFGITPLADRPFRRLSTGEQRLVLLIRGLVKRPPILILDEPFQGLDSKAIDAARRWLDTELAAGQTLIFVSHLPEELPRTVTRRLRLDSGKVVD
ncbi:ATP-binding cassette domain-containing protein [Zavarzinella formosa]|uniref:ATP-binding cassette domain-containing protein n=1 Tax=Zavarzinella formosa TaxID=360055 RepID=UPI000313CEBE|nr:ATP-binding cassette domain-containing protein [Zavarzinella formosa]